MNRRAVALADTAPHPGVDNGEEAGDVPAPARMDVEAMKSFFNVTYCPGG